MPNIYKITSRGLALSAVSVVLAPDELRAKQLHFNCVGFIGQTVELVQKDVVLKVEGVKQEDYIFHYWNGDY